MWPVFGGGGGVLSALTKEKGLYYILAAYPGGTVANQQFFLAFIRWQEGPGEYV